MNMGALSNAPGHLTAGDSTVDIQVSNCSEHNREPRTCSANDSSCNTSKTPTESVYVGQNCASSQRMTRKSYPRIAYARPSLLVSVTPVTHPLATPTAPAKIP